MVSHSTAQARQSAHKPSFSQSLWCFPHTCVRLSLVKACSPDTNRKLAEPPDPRQASVLAGCNVLHAGILGSSRIPLRTHAGRNSFTNLTTHGGHIGICSTSDSVAITLQHIHLVGKIVTGHWMMITRVRG